ncbi:MAG: mannitol dehydrogenase family protein [Planctomycetes bacterium]|nr:mannitol dehydrogenase family protein [Planctomycetota bacterium]
MAEEQYTWLHIGAGSFHRAHQAWYMNELRKQGRTDWHIALGNIRDDVSPMLDALAAQNGEYVLETVDFRGHREYEIIRSIREIVRWDKDLAALTAIGAKESTRVVAFTVTEAGYYLDTTFRLDQTHPDLQADLAGAKTTIYGTVAGILRARMAAGTGPVTLLSCDNVRHNGQRFRDGLIEFLTLRGERDLIGWAEEFTTCPCSMVDRITPRPAADIPVRVLAATGFRDAVPVMGESFIQWVIEDQFAAGRPDLEAVGVLMVSDVQPYEEAKIRLLNVPHSCIAWAGTLGGLEYIHEGVTTPAIRTLSYDYATNNVIPCLTPNPLDLEQYRDTVLDRFANANIRDTNQRVAADSFSKIPAMITPTLLDCYDRGMTPADTAMLPALFFVFLRRWAQGKIPFEYQDAVMNPDAARAMLAGHDPVAAYAGDAALFGRIAGREDFVSLMRDAVARAEGFDKLG